MATDAPPPAFKWMPIDGPVPTFKWEWEGDVSLSSDRNGRLGLMNEQAHKPLDGSIQAFKEIEGELKAELKKIRHDREKHAPGYFASVQNLSDEQLTKFSGQSSQCSAICNLLLNAPRSCKLFVTETNPSTSRQLRPSSRRERHQRQQNALRQGQHPRIRLGLYPLPRPRLR